MHVSVECEQLGWTTTMDHTLSVSQRSVENLVQARMDDSTHKYMANFYDRSGRTFKYEVQLEVGDIENITSFDYMLDELQEHSQNNL